MDKKNKNQKETEEEAQKNMEEERIVLENKKKEEKESRVLIKKTKEEEEQRKIDLLKKMKEDEKRRDVEREILAQYSKGPKTPRTPPQREPHNTPMRREEKPAITSDTQKSITSSAFIRNLVDSPEYEEEPAQNNKRGRRAKQDKETRKRKTSFIEEEPSETSKERTKEPVGGKPTEQLNEETQELVKGKPVETANDEKTESGGKFEELRTKFVELKEIIMKLKKQAETYSNVKKEVKEAIKEATMKTESFARILDEMEVVEAETNDKKVVIRSKTMNKAIQINETDILTEQERRKAKEKEQINKVWECDTNCLEKLKSIIDYQWEDRRFTRTKVEPKPSKLVERVIVFTDIKSTKNQTRYAVANRKIPEFKEAQIERIGYSLDVESRSGIEKENKTIFKVPLDLQMSKKEDTYKAVETLKNILEEEPSIHVEGLTADTAALIRKTIEYQVRRESMEITIEEMPVKVSKRNRILPEAVIVKTEGSNYADVLKKIKQGSNLEEKGISVERVRKTNAGDICIEVKGAGEAGRLKKEIYKSMNEAKIVHIRRDEQICIFDIEPGTTESEIIDCVKKCIGKEPHIRVASLRMTKIGCQIAVVECEKQYAEKLVTLARIRIGWTRCRIKPQVRIVRCYRCLEYGHRRDNCTGENRSRNCYRCNGNGHIAKNCTKTEDFCIKCKTTGHRDDQFLCPAFKQKIKEAREKKRSNTLSRSMSFTGEDDVFIKQ